MFNTPFFWYKKNFSSKLFSLLLSPFSLLYRFGFYIDKKFSKQVSVKNTVISIGGINVGGSGKTPVTIELIKKLNNLEKKTFVVMRGYKSQIKASSLIKKSIEPTYTNADIYGDEASIISQYSDVIIGPNKKDSIKLAEKIDPSRIILLDDGHQSHKIKRDIKLIVINSMQGFGNKMQFPSGPLRESIKSGIDDATCAIIVKQNDFDDFFTTKEYEYIKQNLTTFTCKTSNNIKNKNLYAFCGIGFPWKFFNSLQNNNNILIKTKIFPDHYYYKDADIENLIQDAKANNSSLVTTEKDIVKINKKYYNSIKVAKLEIIWENFDENFFKKICKTPD